MVQNKALSTTVKKNRFTKGLATDQMAETVQAYLFLLPTLIGLFIFSAGAIVASFGLSFTEYSLVGLPTYVGFGNYSNLMNDAVFRNSFITTFKYIGGVVPSSVVLSLILAVIANQKIPGVTIFRTFYVLPVVSSMVAVALIFSWILDNNYGLLNHFLWTFWGIEGPNWLGSIEWALPSLMLIAVWKGLGYNMMLFLAGLQDIPEHLYESAKLDGANYLQQIWYITIPLISPTTFFIAIMSVIGAFQTFESTFLTTQGGPANSTLTIGYYIYLQGFEWLRLGSASAMAWVLFFFIAFSTLVLWKTQDRWVFYA